MIDLKILNEFKEVEFHDDSTYSKLNEPINQIGDNHWFIEISNSATWRNKLVFDWNEAYKDIPIELIVVAQEYIIAIFGGHTNPSTGRIVLKSDSDYRKLRNPSHFFRMILNVYPVLKTWKHLTFEDIQKIIIDSLDKRRKKHKDNGTFKPSIGINFITNTFSILRDFDGKARNVNPLSEYTVSNIPSTKVILKEYFKKEGVTYEEFSKSKHYELIPFHIAMPWLAYIMEQFKSKELSYWRLYWLLVREIKETDERETFPHHNNVSLMATSMQKYIDGTYFFKKGKKTERLNKLVTAYNKNSTHIFGKIIPLNELIDFTTNQLENCEPELRHTRRRSIYTNYLRHLYAAIAITNGPRRSEIIHLKLFEFEEVTNEVSSYKSFIHKTNDGLPTIRNISGFVHDMANKACELGYQDRKEQGVYLFSTQNNLDQNHKFDLGNKASFINHSYQLFLQSLPEELKKEFIEEFPKITSHQARHLFAAFALRVSDGNVFDAIRKHFRHEYDSFMTGDYAEYKLTEEEQEFVEREYIREIIMRIGNKEEHGFFGPMLLRLEKLIEEKVEFWGVDSFSELTEEIDDLTDLIDAVKVHEWGLCLPVKSTITQSKCYDKNTKLPQYDKNSSFSTCSGCIHLLSNDACIEDIKRIAFSIIQTLDNYPVISGSLRKFYKESLKRANYLIKQNTA